MRYTLDVRIDPAVTIVTYEGKLTNRELAESQEAIFKARDISQAQRRYMILDVRQAEIGFAEALANIQTLQQLQRKYRPNDHGKVTLIFVGTPLIIRTYMQFLETSLMGSYGVMAVNDMETALAYIRQDSGVTGSPAG